MSAITVKLKYIFAIFIFMAGFAGYIFFNGLKEYPSVKAAASQIVRGFAWSENIGWISFNCLNDYNGDGTEESHCADAGYPSDYGVNLNADNTLSGFAWSENIGWISFEAASVAGCPSAPCQPGLVGSNFSGWARVCSVFSSGCSGALNSERGGWDGWIKLRKDPDYGVSLNGIDFEGYAWSDMVTGWICFNNLTPGCDLGGAGPAYKVYINIPATVSPNPPELPDYCDAGGIPDNIKLSWVSTNQAAYELKVVRDGAITCDSGKITDNTANLLWGSDINSFNAGCAGIIDFGNHNYTWTIEVWNSSNSSAGVQNGIGFSTPLHKYPDVDFNPPPPVNFLINTPIDFIASGTKCYPAGDTSDCDKWEWDFDYDGAFVSDQTINGTNGNFTYAGYSVPNSTYEIKLRVTDKDGFSCTNTGIPKVLGTKLAKWKEVIPTAQ